MSCLRKPAGSERRSESAGSVEGAPVLEKQCPEIKVAFPRNIATTLAGTAVAIVRLEPLRVALLARSLVGRVGYAIVALAACTQTPQ